MHEYSSAPPSVAPMRFQPNTCSGALVFANATPNNKFAKKSGKNVTSTAATTRSGVDAISPRVASGTAKPARHESSNSANTTHSVFLVDGNSGTARFAASTSTNTPANTMAAFFHVVPNNNENCTTLLVSSSKNAAPIVRNAMRTSSGDVARAARRMANKRASTTN